LNYYEKSNSPPRDNGDRETFLLFNYYDSNLSTMIDRIAHLAMMAIERLFSYAIVI